MSAPPAASRKRRSVPTDALAVGGDVARHAEAAASSPAASASASPPDRQSAARESPASPEPLPPPDTSLLPHPYQHVLSYFPRVWALASLFWHRGAPCTFTSLAPSLGPLFAFTHLRQMVFLCPSLMQLRPLIIAEEKNDPFAPAAPSVQQLPLEAQYELLSTELMKRAAASAAASAAFSARPSRATVAAAQGDRNAVSRPRGPKPTPRYVQETVVAFQRLVVEHFARPDATMRIPEVALPPHAPLEESEARRGSTLVPSYAKLIDELTVSVASNNDPATRPRCAESLEPPSEANGLAALLGVPAADASSAAAVASSPAQDGDDEVMIVDRPSRSSRPRVKRENINGSGADGASAAASSPFSSAAASSSSAVAAPAAVKKDPYADISSPLFHNLIVHLRKQKFYKGQIVYVHNIPARGALTVELKERRIGHAAAAQQQQPPLDGADDVPVYVSTPVFTALRSMTPPIERLFIHQAAALHALLDQKQPAVVVATATSSGKSLCYTIPILEALHADPESRALCLFPTKALAQDQLRSLRSFLQGAWGRGALGVDTLDGDTPRALRPGIQSQSRVLLSNPDMLHVTMLPLHTELAAFWRKLRYVVLDETHVYRGSFGAHVACVLRRLRRVCAFYGSRPQFICASATIANPRELVSKLLSLPETDVTVVQEDGSARGEKQFLLFNPPPVASTEAAADASAERMLSTAFAARAYEYAPFLQLSARAARRSSHMEAALLLANLVQINYKSICFVNSRKVSEIVCEWACEVLRLTPSTQELVPLVQSYRGGYRPEDRRRIEADLFSGRLRGVVSTNALELGIDIGTLDCTVHVGIPGSMASLMQQSGRSGRGIRPSLSILVAYDTPLDQFFLTNPEKLFSRRPEKAVLDTENTHILRMHVMCAAAELVSSIRDAQKRCVDSVSVQLTLFVACALLRVLQPLAPHTDAALFGPRFAEVFHRLLHEEFMLAQRPRDPLIPSPFDAHPCFELVNGTWERSFLGAHGSHLRAEGRAPSAEHGPAGCFSLRSSVGKHLQITDVSTGAVIDETEVRRAMFDAFEGALYSNQGREYIVQQADLIRGSIKVRPVSNSKYYTKCIDRKWTTVMSRTLAFGAEHEQQQGEGGDEHKASEEQKEQVIPPSAEALLSTIHAQLSRTAADIGRPGVLDPGVPSAVAVHASGGALSSSDLSTASLFPYASPTTWYLKAESDSFLLPWRALCAYGRVKVTTSVFAYRKISKLTGMVIDRQELHMPLHEFDSYAAWVDVPRSIQIAFAQRAAEQQEERMKEAEGQMMEGLDQRRMAGGSRSGGGAAAARPPKRAKIEPVATKAEGGAAASSSSASASASALWSAGPPALSNAERNRLQPFSLHAGLHGLTHCMISLLPLYLLCDGHNDLRCDCPSVYERSYEERSARPCRVLMYEASSSSGPAFVRATSQVLHLLVAHARAVIESCPCRGVQGCPACVQSSTCSELNEATSKADALWVATALEQWSREYPLPM